MLRLVKIIRVAVIGGGIAGIVVSQLLLEHPQYEVILVEKARRLGGRASLIPLGQASSVAIGTQVFSMSLDELNSAEFHSSQIMNLFSAKLNLIVDHDEVCSNRYRFKEKAWDDLAITLSKQERVTLRLSHHIKKIDRNHMNEWVLEGERWHHHQKSPFTLQADLLIISAPPPQAYQLIASLEHRHQLDSLIDSLKQTQIEPCWVVAIAGSSSIFNLIDWAYLKHSKIIKMVNSPSQISRTTASEVQTEEVIYTIHATHEWSVKHLEEEPETVAKLLYREFSMSVPSSTMTDQYKVLKSHRWRYSLIHQPTHPPHLYVSSMRLGICGDALAKGQGHHGIQRAIKSAFRLYSEIT